MHIWGSINQSQFPGTEHSARKMIASQGVFWGFVLFCLFIFPVEGRTAYQN
jgi:hypothetical protein